MLHKKIIAFLAPASLMTLSLPAVAADPVAKAMEGYLEFTEYGSSLILPQQIPAEDWKKIQIIDARDAEQYTQGHIPGALNMEWRQIVARRQEVRKDGLVVVYCNTGSLSAQAVFSLRLLGWDNVKVLQGGYEGWKAAAGSAARGQNKL